MKKPPSDGEEILKEITELLQRQRQRKNKGNGRAITKEMLAVLGHTHWVFAGLSITTYLLGKFDKVSENRDECLQLLESVVSLATHVKKLKTEILEEREKLEQAVECIAEGSIIFLKSSVNSESLIKLREKAKDIYDDLSLTIEIAIKHQWLSYLPFLQMPKPDGAVGIQQLLEEVMDLFDMTSRDESSVAVALALVVYGYGGIWKTTLAKAVFTSLHLEGTYDYTSLEMDELADKNDLRRMQEEILMDAFSNYNYGKKIILRHCQEGRYHFIEAFKFVGFLFIDNCLREKDLRLLLPEDLKSVPQRSRILLTTRNLRETDMLQDGGLQCRKYTVQTLPIEEALKILLKKAVDVDLNRMEPDLERIVKVCGGIPLVVKMVGARLRKHNYKVEECTQMLWRKGRTLKSRI